MSSSSPSLSTLAPFFLRACSGVSCTFNPMNLLLPVFFQFCPIFLTYAQTPLPPVKCELSSVTTGSLGWTAEAERGFVADLWSRSIPALPPPRPRLGCKNRIGSGKCRQLWSTMDRGVWRSGEAQFICSRLAVQIFKVNMETLRRVSLWCWCIQSIFWSLIFWWRL